MHNKSSRFFESKLILAVIVILAFQISGCQTGEQHETPPQYQQAYLLDIRFMPGNATLIINNEIIGDSPYTKAVSPGESLDVRIEAQGYIPFLSTITIPPEGYYLLDSNLTRISSRQRITDSGSFSGWIEESLCYIKDESLFCNQNGIFLPVLNFDHSVFWLRYTETGLLLQGIQSESPVIIHIMDESFIPIIIENGWFSADYDEVNDQIFLYGHPEISEGVFAQELSLIQLSPENERKTIPFSVTPEGLFAEGISISSDGQWVATTTSGNVQLWRLESERLVFHSNLEGIYSVLFSPSEPNLLAYLDETGSLLFMDIFSEEKTLISPNVTAYQWFPGEAKIIYSRISNNAFSTIWTLDLVTKAGRIIADSSLILGLVTEMSLSPERDCLIYTNTQSRMEKILIDN